MGARVVGRRAAVPSSGCRGTPLLQHTRSGARSGKTGAVARLGPACRRARRRAPLTGPHAPGARRRCVRGPADRAGRVAGSRYCDHRRSVGCGQRPVGGLCADSPRRRPKRCGGGRSRGMERYRRRRGRRSGAIAGITIRHETIRRHRRCRSEHRPVLLRGWAVAGRSLFIARECRSVVFARCEAASRSLARHARSTDARRSARRPDSRMRTVYVRPPGDLSFVPPRWCARRTARGRDQKWNRYDALKKRARAVAVYRSSSTSSRALP